LFFQREFLQTASEISEPLSFEARRGGAHSAQPLEFRQPNWQKWSGNPGRFTEAGKADEFSVILFCFCGLKYIGYYDTEFGVIVTEKGSKWIEDLDRCEKM